MRYRLTLAYDGTHFHGWQRQLQPEAAAREHGHTAPANPDGRVELRTVQSVITHAVREIIREPANVQGASRTDSGVHAKHQTAAFSTADDRAGPEDERLALAINSRLPDDVLVRSCTRTHDDFNPIAECICKGYTYTLFVSPNKPLWNRTTVHHVRVPLDVAAMQTAAQRLVGTHDFAAFAAAHHGRDSTTRSLILCDVTQRPADDDPDASLVTIHVAADGFLWNMVRIIAGTLLDVGRERLTPANVDTALSTLDRRAAGPTLPPTGLCLDWAHYLTDPDENLSMHAQIDAQTRKKLQEGARERKQTMSSPQESAND